MAILDVDRLFISKGNHINLPMHICKLIHQPNIFAYIRQIITLDNHIKKERYEHKTNTWKQHLDKIDHKHNPHSLWGTIAKLSNKKTPTHKHSL